MTSVNNVTAGYESTSSANSTILPSAVWYLLICISGLLQLTTVYLLVCVLIFIKRKKYRNYDNKPESNKSASSNIALNPKTQMLTKEEIGEPQLPKSAKLERIPNCTSVKTEQGQNSKTQSSMHAVLLATLCVTFVQGIIELLIYFEGGHSDYACDTMAKIMIGFTAFAIYGCTVFLWLRQYGLNSHPVIKKFRPEFLALISRLTYLEMMITLLGNLVLHVWWRDYISLNKVCQPAVGSRRVSAYVPYAALAISTVTIQISLTFLIVYPLVSAKRHKINTKSGKRLIKCVKRLLKAATICIATDVTGALVAMWLPEDIPNFVLSVMYHTDVMLNIASLFYTFIHWKNIIMPWRKTARNT